MKHLFAILTALALLGFTVPAFACDGSKKAKADDTTVTSSETTADADDKASVTDGDEQKKAKKVVKKEGEV